MDDLENVMLEGTVEAETDLAVLIAIDGDPDNKVWFPKSRIEWESSGALYKKGDSIEFEIPEWLVIAKGLI